MRQSVKHSLQRWLDLLLYALVGVLAAMLLRAPLASVAHWVETVLWDGLPMWAVFAGIIVLFLATTALLDEFRLLEWGHFRHLHRYPPLWLAAFSGALVAAILVNSRDAVAHFTTAVICLFLCKLMLDLRSCAVTLPATASHRQPPMLDSAGGAEKRLDFEWLRKWLSSDEPIASSVADFFNLSRISDRIARRLQQTPLRTCAIVGPYGCGKTSIRCLVEGQLSAKRFWTCHVDSWGLQEDGAAEYILRKVLNEMGRHADCLALATLPRRYKGVLEGAEKVTSHIRARKSPRQPRQTAKAYFATPKWRGMPPSIGEGLG